MEGTSKHYLLNIEYESSLSRQDFQIIIEKVGVEDPSDEEIEEIKQKIFL